MMKILITGGSGNLGRYLLGQLCDDNEGFKLGYTYNATELGLEGVESFQVDFGKAGKDNGWEACLRKFNPDVVVNCAALARPGVCQNDPEFAHRVNDTKAVTAGLQEACPDCLVIHISTDLVYEGNSDREKKLYTEDDELKPVNVYGETKVAAEKHLREVWPNHTCLRSSMIYGPVPEGQKSSHFTHFVDTVLKEGKATSFFHDEYRCPTFIGDFVTAINAIIKATKRSQKTTLQAGLKPAYNIGGERLSRLEMAQKICALRGYDEKLIISESADSIDRGVKTPKDTGMDSSQLEKDLGIKLTGFDAGIRQCFPGDAHKPDQKKQKT